MRKAFIALAAVAALMATACKDNELKQDRGDRLGDARPDNGKEGFFENDGVDDNKEADDQGLGGSGRGDVDNNDPIDVNVDKDRGKIDVETEKR